MAVEIDIYGTLHNATPDGTLAKAAQIHDDALGRKQSDINRDFGESIENLRTDVTEIKKSIGEIGTTLDKLNAEQL